mmetsp:Transcript_3406/g.11178  ORF Transcript_3406/g.11178 Transcript_3406/m.11178 type:complete len:289 (-) Transcript_3406:99-965(-)
MIVFAGVGGVSASYALLVEFGFVFFIIFLLIYPVNVLITAVALPNLIRDKLEHNPKLNLSQYPFSAELPEDALDYLLDVRPTLRRHLPEPDDDFAQHLRACPKESLTLEMLEEINRDLHWKSVATTTAGLVVAKIFLSLPNDLQEALYQEIIMASPFGAFFIVSPFLDENIGSTILLLVVSLLLAYLVVYGVGQCAAFFHNRALMKRDARYLADRERTHNFISTTPPEEKLPDRPSQGQTPAEPASRRRKLGSIYLPTSPVSPPSLTSSSAGSKGVVVSKHLRSPLPY